MIKGVIFSFQYLMTNDVKDFLVYLLAIHTSLVMLDILHVFKFYTF
jgi:hypothetical protein